MIRGATLAKLPQVDAGAKAQAVEGVGIKKVGKLSLAYALGDTLSRGTALLLLPLYTHFMTPSDYGMLALASMLGSFLVMLLSFGGASIVVRFYNQYDSSAERDRFLASFWAFLICVPGVLIGLLYLTASWCIGWLFHGLPLHPYIELILATAYVNIAFGTILPALLRVRERAKLYLLLSTLQLVLVVSLTVPMVVVVRGGAVGALTAQLIAVLLSGAVAAAMLFRQLGFAFRVRDVRSAVEYGLPLVPHFAAHWVLSISDRAILERLAGIATVGVYSLAYQFGTILQMVLTSINGALGPMFSKAAREPGRLIALSRVTTYYYGAVCVFALAIALTGGDFIQLLTPPAYHGAGRLVPLIALGTAAMGCYFIPMNLLSLTAGRTKFVPVITIFSGGVNVALNLVLVPWLGAMAAAINTAVGYAVLALLTTLYANRMVAFRYEGLRLFKLAVVCLAAYAAGASLIVVGPILHLILSIVLVAFVPLVLALTRFWTADETAMFQRRMGLFRVPIRTIRRQG